MLLKVFLYWFMEVVHLVQICQAITKSSVSTVMYTNILLFFVIQHRYERLNGLDSVIMYRTRSVCISPILLGSLFSSRVLRPGISSLRTINTRMFFNYNSIIWKKKEKVQWNTCANEVEVHTWGGMILKKKKKFVGEKKVNYATWSDCGPIYHTIPYHIHTIPY